MSDDNSNDDEPPLETKTGGMGDGGKNNDCVTGAGDADDDRVGYGRPPKRYQFKPGQSGNLKGRTKGAKGMKAMLRKELNARVRITENGRSRSVSKMEVMIKRLTEQGARGDLKAISKLIELGQQVFGMDDEPDRNQPLNAGEQAVIDAAKERRIWLAKLAEDQAEEDRESGETDASDKNEEDEQ